MIPIPLIDDVKRLRAVFEEALATLGAAASFQSLLTGSDLLATGWKEMLETAASPRFRRAVNGRIVCAIVGASSHGKTTTLNELFPELARRQWLITEATDTTSQSLRIEYAPPGSPEAERVTVHSWEMPQITRLARAAEEENRAMGISTSYGVEAVVIDGTAASLDPVARRGLKFPLQQELRAFPRPHVVTKEQAADGKFIRALTIKDLSDKVDPRPVLTIESASFNSLQLRAVVKDVTLHDPFERITALSGRAGEPPPASDLVFVDTPGLGTAGSAKDEVLVHVLAEKSPQIVLQLLEDDELDIVLHLVLCGGQSTFGKLWEAIEKERGRSEIEALVSERLFVVINGTNRLFNDPNLARKWDAATAEKEGDVFSSTLRDNILEKMVPKGSVTPAGICFVDSIQHVGRGDSVQYAEFYAKQKPLMLQALQPGGAGFETLRRLRLDHTFADNIEALCNPEDRGHGFLIRQIMRLVEEKGPAMFLRRHLVRTGLIARLRELREMLARSYEDDGSLRSEAVQETLRQCLRFLEVGETGDSEFAGIEAFASARLDAAIDTLPMGRAPASAAAEPRARRARRIGPDPRGDEDWVGQAFRQTCTKLEAAILERAGAEEGIAREFTRYFRARTEDWARQWGYDAARLANPLERAQKTDRLVRHCLKLHCREILYQLLLGESTGSVSLQQSDDEKRQIAALMRGLDEALATAAHLCREHQIDFSL